MKLIIRHKGGAGSGFHGHRGRPGKVGGSSGSKGSKKRVVTNKKDPWAAGDVILNEPGIFKALKMPVVMYHVTERKNLESYKTHGIVAKYGASKEGFDRGAYLTPDPMDVIRTQPDIVFKDPVIIKIETKNLNLRLDPEYWGGETVEDAKEYISGINADKEQWSVYSKTDIPSSEFIRIIEPHDFRWFKSMKLIVAKKGGLGSGFHGHRGRPGKVGGSSGGKGSGDKGSDGKTKVFTTMESIHNNPIMRRIAAGLMADGGIDDVANVEELVADELNVSMSGEAEEDTDIESKLYADYENATASEGYFVEGNITDARKRWEEYHYGRITNGFHNGEKFAQQSIKDFIKTGKVPEGKFDSEKPKKEIRQRKYDPKDDLTQDERFWLLNDSDDYWELSNPSLDDLKRLLRKMPKG